MPKGYKAKPQRPEAYRLIEENKLSTKQIAQQTGYTTVSINRFKKNLQLKKAKPGTLGEPKVEIEKIAPAIPPPELMETTPGIEITPTPEIEAALKAKDIEGVFQGINELLPQQYKRTKGQISLLGNVWEKPLNRMMEKYVDENVDLYIAIIVTILVFAPVPIQYARDKQKVKKKNEGKDITTPSK